MPKHTGRPVCFFFFKFFHFFRGIFLFLHILSVRAYKKGGKALEVENFATYLMEMADAYGSSDIHILPEETHYGVFFRVNEGLKQQHYLNLDEGRRLISYFKYLGNMDVGERRRPQSGAAAVVMEGTKRGVRFSTMMNFQSKESMVVRLLARPETVVLTQHTFFPQEVKRMEQLVQYSSGLLLFSGPVGSGKTTTMYHLVRQRALEGHQQIITVEDPVEIEEPHFLQTQVNNKAGITYEKLLKSSLRHHPDILIVGEIRDEETAKTVMRGALTGHLILASVHAKNPEGVISRLMELGVSREMLKQTLIGIVFQKLIPRYCGLCENDCRAFCTHNPVRQKKAALYDVRSDEGLNKIMDTHNHAGRSSSSRSFNKLLRKAWMHGYISEKNYYSYYVP